MTITCEKDSDNLSWLISYNDQPYAKVHQKIIKYPKLITSLDKQDFPQALEELLYKQTKRYVLFCLSKQNIPSFLLIHKLQQFHLPKRIIGKIVQEMIDSGYINDKEWVNSQIRQFTQKKYGVKAIRFKLIQKKVPIELINECLVEDVEDEKEQIMSLLSKKARSCDLSNFKERKKVINSLLRKGFPFELIYDCFRLLSFSSVDN